MKSVSVHIRPAADPAQHAGEAVIVVRDPALLGREAIYTLTYWSAGHPRRPPAFFTQRTTLSEETTIVPIPWSAAADAFTYETGAVRIGLRSDVVVNDGTTTPPAAFGIESRPLAPRVGGVNDEAARQAIFPPDRYRFFENLAALPARMQLLFAALALAWLTLFVWNMSDIVADWSGPPVVDQREADNALEESADLLPFSEVAMVATLLLGAGLWWLLSRHAGRSYVTLGVKNESLRVEPGTVVPIGDLVRGTVREPLGEATLRVVAVNYVSTQLKPGATQNSLRPRGLLLTQTSWVFAAGVVLYEQTVPALAAGASLDRAFSGNVDFGPLFAALSPPITIGSDYGVKTMWLVQLISPALRDYETSPLPIAAPPSAYQPGERRGFEMGRDGTAADV
ncbi:MAG TPA: hypothetical protein VGE52_16290 [Pirellulales bacterium]